MNGVIANPAWSLNRYENNFAVHGNDKVYIKLKPIVILTMVIYF